MNSWSMFSKILLKKCQERVNNTAASNNNTQQSRTTTNHQSRTGVQRLCAHTACGAESFPSSAPSSHRSSRHPSSEPVQDGMANGTQRSRYKCPVDHQCSLQLAHRNLSTGSTATTRPKKTLPPQYKQAHARRKRKKKKSQNRRGARSNDHGSVNRHTTLFVARITFAHLYHFAKRALPDRLHQEKILQAGALRLGAGFLDSTRIATCVPLCFFSGTATGIFWLSRAP